MKRTIKFRAKRLPDGKWVYGDLTHATRITVDADVPCLRVCGYDVDEDTIGQFTGFKDRNGKEIYEGDIITVNGRYPRVVLWDKMSWALMPCEHYHDKLFWAMNLQHPGNDWWELFADKMEVVGNIYDNPELLKPNSNAATL